MKHIEGLPCKLHNLEEQPSVILLVVPAWRGAVRLTPPQRKPDSHGQVYILNDPSILQKSMYYLASQMNGKG